MKLLILAPLAIIVILAGCINVPICNPPYIPHEDKCCLDKNYNAICDSDEGQQDATDKNVTDGFVCPGGSMVSDTSQCPKQIDCGNGQIVYNQSSCPAKPLEEPGWYTCNGKTNPPCDDYLEAYCGRIMPKDLEVRVATSQAIAKHPGAFSINQILDIYDWVHTNVFYQNVPVDLSYQPYPPSETLQTKSGDCKNQAVLIASMIESIGGSARILLIPDCEHAYAEVYMGNNSADIKKITTAIRAHYPQASGKDINWHTSKNNTEYWFILDTAGGSFPGETIPECFDAEQTFVVYNCASEEPVLNAPEVVNTEYGPNVIINDTQIIKPDGYSYYHYVEPSLIPNTYSWCRYKITTESLSYGQIDWYITDQQGYENYMDYKEFSYYYGEEQVKKGNYQIDWDNSGRLYVIAYNNGDSTITVKTEIVETCYKD